MAIDDLESGEKLNISKYIPFYSDKADILPLVSLSPEKLKQLEQESIAQEKAIYDKLLEVVQEWTKQAGRTLDLKRAQAYLKTQPVSHTSNQWTIDQYGRHVMSNMVYYFSWRECEWTKWDRTTQKEVPIAWELSWSLRFNTVKKPDHTGSSRQIAGQDKKVFKDRAAMEKYLRGRIAAYAHLFTEISPPIPEKARRRFCVHGVLLPGYTVETPASTQPDPDTVDDLLSYLDDDDMSNILQPEEREPPSEPSPPKLIPKKTPTHKHGRSAPTR